VPGENQEIRLDFNDTTVVTHEWQNCEPWEAAVDIPPELVRVGQNDLVLHSRYAATPTSKADNEDTRRLSVGFTKLSMAPVQGDQNPNQP
jgi:hypothetical protein